MVAVDAGSNSKPDSIGSAQINHPKSKIFCKAVPARDRDLVVIDALAAEPDDSGEV